MTRSEFFQQTPLPIETAYFLNDAVKLNTEGGYKLMRDPNKFNRFYFNYPPEWKTSNTGEMIVGVRSLWTLNKRRTFELILYIRKYRKKTFYKAARKLYPDEYGEMGFAEFIHHHMDDNKIQMIIDTMPLSDVIVFAFPIYVKISSNQNMTDIFNEIDKCLSNQTSLKNFLKLMISMIDKDEAKQEDILMMYQTINKYTNEELGCKYQWGFWFDQGNNDTYFAMNKDVNMTGSIDSNSFNQKLYSPRNDVNFLDPFYVDIMLTHSGNTYMKRYRDWNENEIHSVESLLNANEILPPIKHLYNPHSRPDPKPLDDSDKFDDDFNTVFNIGDLPYQNSLDYITTFHREIKFKNVYDRSTVKVHASFANQSNEYYVGNSHVYFNPIKYYKLNSKDDKFWIDFYSGRHHDCPVNIPDDEGFVLEMLFMQNQKLLYV